MVHSLMISTVATVAAGLVIGLQANLGGYGGAGVRGLNISQTAKRSPKMKKIKIDGLRNKHTYLMERKGRRFGVFETKMEHKDTNQN